MLTTATADEFTATEMALRFRKRIRVAPGVRINLSSKGISSATIGPRGASVNIGKRGTYLNAGIPGTGIYARERISSPGKKASRTPRTDAAPSGKGGAWVVALLVLIALIVALR